MAALCSDEASASLHRLFPQLDHAFVCDQCHQACLRLNSAAEQWLSLRDGGRLRSSELVQFLAGMPRRQCAVSSSPYLNAVSRGCCRACYFIKRPSPTRKWATCASVIHGDVSTNRRPTARPGLRILRILWADAKATEQAAFPSTDRDPVCSACRILAEKRSQAATTAGTTATVPSPTLPAVTPSSESPMLTGTVPQEATRARGLAGPTAGDTITPAGEAHAISAGGERATALLTAQATRGGEVGLAGATSVAAAHVSVDSRLSGTCATAAALIGARRLVAVADARDAAEPAPMPPIRPADGSHQQAGAALDTVRPAIHSADGGSGLADATPGAFGPSVDVALATVIAATGTFDEAQWQSIVAIVSAHLVAEKPQTLRARSTNGRDLLYTRQTVSVKAVVGPRHARRPSLEESLATRALCRDNEEAMERVLGDVSRQTRDARILAVVPSAAIAALPTRLQTQFVVANSISYETWQRIRRFMGGPRSGLASAAVMRADGRAAFSEARHRVTSSALGATLASPRAAVEAMVADLVARNQFIDRLVAGRPAGEILLAFGLDKGGCQSSCKAIL